MLSETPSVVLSRDKTPTLWVSCLSFDYTFTRSPKLGREVEFPVKVLNS